MKNYYSILGVLPTAEHAVIKAAYRALCQIYHPDKFDGDKNHAHKILQDLNEAWAVLSDEAARRRYDAELSGYDSTYDSKEEMFEDNDVFTSLFPEMVLALDYYPNLE